MSYACPVKFFKKDSEADLTGELPAMSYIGVTPLKMHKAEQADVITYKHQIPRVRVLRQSLEISILLLQTIITK
jgi:hypothetical protein